MGGFDGAAYQARIDALEAAGSDIHGEARLVMSYAPSSVLDAGCGTGRVAIELARHGISTTGVDMDRSMIAEAGRRAPRLEWVRADLAGLDLSRLFDVVVMAGNVPVFCAETSRARLVRSCARHVAPGGHLITGFQLDRGYSLGDYDRAAEAAGLELEDRWCSWERGPWQPGGDYAVSVHVRPGPRHGTV